MWEWRIFFKDAFFAFPEPLTKLNKFLFKNPSKERTDRYYNLKVPQYGLKIRGSTPYRLELKILKEKRKWGAELWRKPYKITLSYSLNEKYRIDTLKLTNLLEESKIKNSYSNREAKEEVIKLLKQEKNFPIPVHKRRTKTFFTLKNEGISFDFEYVNLKIFGQSWNSLSFEASSLENLEILKKIIIPREGLVMGYPEFVMNMDK